MVQVKQKITGKVTKYQRESCYKVRLYCVSCVTHTYVSLCLRAREISKQDSIYQECLVVKKYGESSVVRHT